VNPTPSILKDILERLAASLGLIGYAAFDQVARSVGGDLARDEDLVVGLDGLGLGGGIVLLEESTRARVVGWTYVGRHGWKDVLAGVGGYGREGLRGLRFAARSLEMYLMSELMVLVWQAGMEGLGVVLNVMGEALLWVALAGNTVMDRHRRLANIPRVEKYGRYVSCQPETGACEVLL